MSQPRIQLHYSNRTERLLEALIENFESLRQRPGASIFDAPTLVVPNPNVETYVKFGIAQATGIAANLEVRQLKRFLGDVVAASAPDVELVAGLRLQGLVLRLLCDEALLAEAELAPVRRYLVQADGNLDGLDRRRFQLSVQIARLFEEYTYSRPALLAAWPRRLLLGATGLAETEVWQRRLWLALWGQDGLVARRRPDGKRWMMLPGLFEVLKKERLVLAPQLHIFGLSYVARTFQELFRALASRTELHIYTLNPCREYWEDLQTDRERSRAATRVDRLGADLLDANEDPFHLGEARGNAALRLWGRPGRENIRMLNELTDCDFVARFDEPAVGASSLLTRVQDDILVGKIDADQPELDRAQPADGSLRILACAGVRREAETIASEIWKLLEADEARPPLRFNDIAVILSGADRAAYQAHLAAALRETYAIPHNIVDLELGSESRLVEAAGLLFALPYGRATREEVLRLVSHPNLIARYPGAEPEAWARWCESLGVVHGIEHADHAGSYIERDLYNWAQGARRLALGAFMSGRRSGDERLYPLGDEAYLPEELAPDELGSATGLASLVRSVLADARHARDAQHTMAEWISLLRELLSTYLVPTSDEDERALLRCLAAVQGLAEVELDEARIGYRLPYELAMQALASLEGSRGQHLADGVVVSAFLPMRAIPFRVVFVAGLGERQFPAPDRRDQLDLRSARRMAGDVSPRERDKYMFLETVLCARERLYLSYVARDPLSGEALEPSSVIRELEQLLEHGYLGAGGAAKLHESHPLRRYDERYFGGEGAPALQAVLPPEARREAEARALGQALRRELGGGVTSPDRTSLAATLSPPIWSELSRKLGYCPSVAAPAIAASPAGPRRALDTVRVSLSALRRFLECPLQGAARLTLGLQEEGDEDLTARQDEPFSSERRVAVSLLRASFFGALPAGIAGSPPPFSTVYDAQVERLVRSGLSPSALFAEAERGEHLHTLSAWWQALVATCGGDAPRLRHYRFGAAELHDPVDELLPAIIVPEVALADGRRVRVELVGRTEAELDTPRASLSLVHAITPEKPRRPKLHLAGFLDSVALAATGRSDPAGRSLLCDLYDANKHTAVVHSLRLRPITEVEARTYLAALTLDLLGQVHDYLLPCETVLAARASGAPVGPAVKALAQDDRAGFSSLYGPVPRPRSYAPPEETRAQALIERRFGLFFSASTERAAAAREED